MVTSIHTAAKELRAYGGHFLTGDYSPARRTAVLSTIPARASAGVGVRPRHTPVAHGEVSKDFTRIPTMPQPRAIWQYETVHYVAESSLSALSLALTDTDADVNALSAVSLNTLATVQKKSRWQPREHTITERLHIHDVTAIDTVPPLVSHAFGAGKKSDFAFRPSDQLRWWLLQPGRLEFLLWFVGTIFLICTSLLLCLLLLSSLGYLVRH
jgi:hypothetical protein